MAVKAGRWVWDSRISKLVPRDEYYRNKEQSTPPVLTPGLEPFTSPIDGSVITDRAQLRRHNAKHGVTDPRDYGDGWFDRKAKERESVLRSDTEAARRERVNTINEII